MAITKAKKEQLLEQYVSLTRESQAVLFLSMRQVGVNEVTQLRVKMRELGAGYMVVKNTLFKLALAQLEQPVPEFLTGPVSVVFCGEDIASTVKAVQDFGNSLGERDFAIIGSVLGKDVLGSDQARALANLPSRQVLFAQVLGGLHAPASRLAGAISGGIRQILTVIQARVDQLKESAA